MQGITGQLISTRFKKFAGEPGYLLLEVLFGLTLFSGLALVTLGILRNTTASLSSTPGDFQEIVRKLRQNPNYHRKTPHLNVIDRRQKKHGTWLVYRWTPPRSEPLEIPLYQSKNE